MSDEKLRPYVHRINVFSGSSGSQAPQGNSENFGRPVDFMGRDLSSGLTKSEEALAKSSTQGNEELNNYSSEQLDIVAPPYDLKFLSGLNTISVTRRACIDAKATNVAGLGYRIKKVTQEVDETDCDDISDDIKMQLERWAAKGQLSFSELIFQVKFDEESNGNGTLEVSRNRKGEIDGLYHIPSHTVRVKKDRSGFVQILSNGIDRVGFYNFGDKYELKEDGTLELLPDRDRNINELIHFKIYSEKSQFYGVPVDLAAIPTIMADEAARDQNNKFFKYSATPEIALVFTVDAAAIPTLYGDQPIKVEIDPNTKRDIEEHFRRNLSAKTFEPAIFHLPPGVALKVEKLSSEQRDAGWQNFRKANKAEIREAHRTPAVITGGADANYATAAIEKSIYLEQVIMPEQDTYEQKLMALLWPELVMIKDKLVPSEIAEDGDITINPPVKVAPPNGTGVNPDFWKLDFKEMSVADKSVDAQVDNIYATLGVLTINEIRMRLGMKPLPEGDKAPVNPKPGAEGNAAAQNAQMLQAASANPEAVPFVSNLAPGVAMKADITGLGNGRGHNGSVTPKMPRRPFDRGGFNAANMGTVGHPMQKMEPIKPFEPFQPLKSLEPSPTEMPKSFLDQLLEDRLGEN